MMGFLISKLTKSNYSDFIHKHLWEPMGMDHTFLGPHDPEYQATSGLQLADGYWYRNSTNDYVKQPITNQRADEGAGAVMSNVLDYIKYLRIMMSESGPLSSDGHRELKAARIIRNQNQSPFTGPTMYCLGWETGIFQNEQVWFHGGWVSQYRTEMLMIPSKEIGIVVMVNTPEDAVHIVLYRILYDLFNVGEEKRYDFEAA